MTVKKMNAVLLLLLIVLAVWISPAPAEPVTEQLLAQPYKTTINDETFQMNFIQGPFGPGISGNTVLTGADASISYPFTGYESGIVDVQGLGSFYFAGSEIVWIESTFLSLKAVEQNEVAARH
jgi:hypothetical protein